MKLQLNSFCTLENERMVILQIIFVLKWISWVIFIPHMYNHISWVRLNPTVSKLLDLRNTPAELLPMRFRLVN